MCSLTCAETPGRNAKSPTPPVSVKARRPPPPVLNARRLPPVFVCVRMKPGALNGDGAGVARAAAWAGEAVAGYVGEAG